MIGHGRPSSLTLALARIALLVCAVAVSSASAQEITPPNEPVRLHISWGGGDANQWTGRISLDRGSLSDLKLLGKDADAAGSFWLEQAQLRIATLSPHKSDSIEITAIAAPDAKLLIELSPGSTATPSKAAASLADLLRRPYQLRLDDRGNTLDIRVVPTPALRIKINGESPSRETLIFRPGDQLLFELEAVLPESLGGTTLDVQTTLSHARRRESLLTDKKRLNVPVDKHPKVELNVPLQQSEGVYTVHVAVSRPSGYFRDKFLPGAATPLAERSFQIVVLDSRPPVRDPNARWDSVLEIDPTNPRWFERLPSWTQVRFIPGLNHGALGSIRAGTVDSPLGRFIELPRTETAANPHWQAYSLPLEAVGVPHVLEIDYPADEEQHFGLSIVEPNATGVVEGIHRDAGVYVEGLGRSEAKQKETQRLIFWPRTQAPLLVVTNQHPSAAARFGQIRVLKRTGSLSAGFPTSPARERMVAAYLARPLAAETFGATGAVESRDAISPQSVGDSQTAYETATRLADYVRFGGYNSAVVSAMADGSAIFPVSQTLLTPHYDSGRSVDRLQNSDALELTLSVFDREGLILVPAIEFAAPLAELEKLRRAGDPQTTGLELVGPNGHTWRETYGTRSGLAPYYNVLEPRVQQQMLTIVGEVVERYGHHPAFGGVAIQLTSDGYTQLPGPEWGLDDSTVERFQLDTSTRLDASDPQKRFTARQIALTSPNSPHFDAWRAWRARQIANFYARMSAIVRGNSDRRLLLTTEKLFDHPQIGQRLRPNLPMEPIEHRVASTMLGLGLDRQSLEKIQGIVLSPTRYVEPMSPLPERAVDLELNDAFVSLREKPDAAATPAAQLYHRPLQWRLASFNANSSPFRMIGELQFTSQPMPHGAAARQPYLQALLERDPAVLVDGGDLLPLGQEEMLRTVRSVVAELPESAQVSDVAKQPVTVRAYAEPNQVTFVIMNLSPWRADAQVTLNVPQFANLQPLAAPNEDDNFNPIKTLLLAAGRQPWKVSLAPYDLQAVRVAVPGTTAIDVQVQQADGAYKELAARIADLADRDLSAPREYRVLTNPGFEQLGGLGQLPGWHLTKESRNGAIVPDATGPQEGKACLYFRNAGPFAAVESDPFPTPATGQLAMTVFARGENFAPDTQLRLVFEDEQDGQHYRKAAIATVNIFGAQRANQRWGRPIAIWVNDLPLESNGKMRIKFELTGPGEVWLDNVKLNDVLFSLSFYEKSQDEILQLVQRTASVQSAFDAGQLSDCLQLLDGYWPRFVLAYRPADAPKVATMPAATPAAPAQQQLAPQPNEGEQPAPGMGDRLKRIVPPFLR